MRRTWIEAKRSLRAHRRQERPSKAPSTRYSAIKGIIEPPPYPPPQAAVVVPGDEDDGVGPQPALDDRIDLVRRPFLAGLDRFDRVLAEAGGSVDPGNGGELAGGRGGGEFVGGRVVLAALERGDISL